MSFKSWFASALQEGIQKLEASSPLGAICRYALEGEGKRVRPLIVFLIAQSLDSNRDVSAAARSVEYFHTASLIVDDLPCMDDERIRRGQETVHSLFGEGRAILASYALITAAFEEISQASKRAQDLPLAADRAAIAFELASRLSGIDGATGGQYLDLYEPGDPFEVIYKKTITLFQLSFVLGVLFGGGEMHLVPLARKAGYHFGMAFQIADDLIDLEQDRERNSQVNLVMRLGKEEAVAQLEKELCYFDRTLSEMKIDKALFEFIQKKLLGCCIS